MSGLWVPSLIVVAGFAFTVLCTTLLCCYVVAASGGKTEGLRDVAVVIRALAAVMRALMRVGFHRSSSKDSKDLKDE